MSLDNPSRNRSFAVAIVGAGPSGFYTAEALLRASDDIEVWMFEKLPVPFGLVRYGVAPDHPKLKAVTAVFDRIAGMEGFHFCGNVEVGRDVSIAALQEYFGAVVFSYGTESGTKLGITGEDLLGSHTAHAFVAWYNGHPDFRDLPVDLNTDVAAIIGNGNVALDVARILAKSVDELRKTDIADHALDILSQSRIREVHVIGRRGPAQIQFVSKELREFGEIEGVRSVSDVGDMVLGDACAQEIADANAADRKVCYDLLRGFNQATSRHAARVCRFRFLSTPEEIVGDSHVTSLTLRRNRLTGEAFAQRAEPTDETHTLPCGLIISSVGYRAGTIETLALASTLDHLEHTDGRLTREGTILPGLYVAGWAKRGPKGTIGTNRGDSVETVAALLEDKNQLATLSNAVRGLIETLPSNVVTYGQWRAIDALEMKRGTDLGRPRVKMTTTAEMLDTCHLTT